MNLIVPMNLVFDIETDDLKATKIHCIVAQDVDTKEIFKFPPNKLKSAIQQSIKLLERQDFQNYNIIDLRIHGKIVVE